jgi:hypothetical protein
MTRTLRSFLTAFILWMGVTNLDAAPSKSATAYFHGAASQYVAGKIQEATIEVEEGLRHYPDDTRLRALGDQLGKMKDQQRGDQSKDENKDGKKDDKKEDGKDKNKGDQNKPDDSKNPSDQNRKNKPGKDGDQKGEKDQKDDKKDGDKQQPPKPGENPQDKGDDKNNGKNAPGPGKMSEDEAKRLLNSFADDEKKEQAERRRGLRERAGTEQDW